MSETDWTPALVVLGVAGVAGIALAVRGRGDRSLGQEGDARHSELLREKDSLYGLLREHHAARATTVDAQAWAQELDHLERDAARVLRNLDQLDRPATQAATAGRRTGWSSLAWGLGSALLLGGIGWWVQESATVRGQGESLTGGTAPSSDTDRALAALEQAVEANPNDVAARNRLGHAYLSIERPMDAFKQAEAVAKIVTDDPEARTHQAVVLLTMGDVDTAGKVLDKVLTTAPGFAEALGWRGAIHYQLAEYPQAVARWESAVAADAGLQPTLAPLIAAAKDPSTIQRGAASARAEATPAADAAPSPTDVTGSLTASGAPAAGATIFLFARPEGVTSAPPTWVKRLPVTTFPLDFRIGPADAMMGGAAPASVVLTARVDADGNPSTKGVGDLEGQSGVVKPGATGVSIALAPVKAP